MGGVSLMKNQGFSKGGTSLALLSLPVHERNKAALLLLYLSKPHTGVSTSTCLRGKPAQRYNVSRP